MLEFKTYTALDRPSVIFGVRGRFIYCVFIGAAAGIILGLLVGMFVALKGIIIFSLLLGVAAGIAVAFVLQSKFSEKELFCYLAMFRRKHFIIVRPGFRLLSDGNDRKQTVSR